MDNYPKLTKDEKQKLDGLKCPDCGSGLLAGPEGVCAINVRCENDKCASKFNICQVSPASFGAERISAKSPNGSFQ